MSESLIRASEIAEYVYCRRAWWLSRVGAHTSENVQELAQGRAYHRQHGRLVRRAQAARRFVYVLLFLAISIFVFLVVRGV